MMIRYFKINELKKGRTKKGEEKIYIYPSSFNSIYSLISIFPSADDTISVTGKDGVGISTPSSRDASRKLRSLLTSLFRKRDNKLTDNFLLLKIEDLKTSLSSSAKPVLVGVEDELINFASSLELVHVLAFLKIPDEDGTFLASSSADGTLRRDGNSVKVASGTGEVVLQFEFLTKAPDLDKTIPAARDSNRVGSIRREGNIRNPLAVTVEGVFAFTKGVPELDKTITTARHDLTVVSREGNTKNILSVTNEATSANTVGKIPETKGVIPAAGKSIVTIIGQLQVLNKVVVTIETTLSMSVFLAGASKFPDHNSPVPRTRDEQVSALASCSQGSDCSVMSADFCDKLKSHL